MTSTVHPLVFMPRANSQGLPAAVKELIARGALFIVNHSGGKDSQAMFHFVMAHVPREQVRVVHAILPEVEWDGVVEHIHDTTLGMEVHTCRSRRTLLQMIEERGMFPSPTLRQCTSDLKRGPIEKVIRGLVEDRIRTHLGKPLDSKLGTQERADAIAAGMGLVVNCMGMRAEESSNRAKLETLKFSTGNSKAGREWYDWLPIHDWLVGRVFSMIASVGQKAHWAYAAGMSRLSCVFCIMASKDDLTTAARLNPKMYRQYVMLERTTGQVMMMPTKNKGPLTLIEITGVPIEEDDESLMALARMPVMKALADAKASAAKEAKAAALGMPDTEAEEAGEPELATAESEGPAQGDLFGC